jgi:hypothetical protein
MKLTVSFDSVIVTIQYKLTASSEAIIKKKY